MEIIQITGNHAYSNHCPGYHYFSPEEIPKFTSLSDCFHPADQLCKEKEIIYSDEELEKFLAELFAPDNRKCYYGGDKNIIIIINILTALEWREEGTMKRHIADDRS